MKEYSYNDDWTYIKKRTFIDAKKLEAIISKIAEFGFTPNNFVPSFEQHLQYYDAVQIAAYRAFPFTYQQCLQIRMRIVESEEGLTLVQAKTKKRVDYFLTTYGTQVGGYKIGESAPRPPRIRKPRPSESRRVSLSAEETAIFSELIQRADQAKKPAPTSRIWYTKKQLARSAKLGIGSVVSKKWAEWLRAFHKETQAKKP